MQRIIREKLENVCCISLPFPNLSQISDPIEQYLRSLYQFLESAPSNGTIDATHRFACSCMVRCAVQFQAVTNLSEYSHTLLDRIIQQSLWHFKDTKSLGRQEFLPFVVTCQLISEMLLPVNSCEKVRYLRCLFILARSPSFPLTCFHWLSTYCSLKCLKNESSPSHLSYHVFLWSVPKKLAWNDLR